MWLSDMKKRITKLLSSAKQFLIVNLYIFNDDKVKIFDIHCLNLLLFTGRCNSSEQKHN